MNKRKQIFGILACIILIMGLLSSSCDDECTRILKLTNTGSDSLIIATRLLGSNQNTCKLVPLDTASAFETAQVSQRHCWKGELEASNFEIFVVNPSHFNEGAFYGCDSIEIMNEVLGYRNLTAADIPNLETSGFEIFIP